MRIFIASLLILFFSLNSFSQTTHLTDGPYVFYENGEVYVRSVVYKDGGYHPALDSFPEKQKVRHIITVHCQDHPDWDFTVRLRKKIVTPPAISRTHRKARVFVLSDIEGEFKPFRELLLAAKVIDKNYHWTFGKGKLIIAGDLFDRGRQVSQYLWLLYKLEDEAAAKKGEVHVVLGNHDIMNLSGDFRYVEPEYSNDARLMGKEYKDLYGSNTELGRWLRSKNIIENINGLLVMHAGLSSAILSEQKTVAALNRVRPFSC